MINNAKIVFVLLCCCTSFGRSEDYPTCTVPDTTIINQLKGRIAALDAQNQNLTDAVTRLEEELRSISIAIEALPAQRTLLMERVIRLENQVTAIMENQNNLLARERALQDPTWFTPFNGFQYRRSASRQNWTASRRVCLGMGGDLASEGIQNNNVRRRIAVTLALENTWIGLSDRGMEGRWRWIDGTISTRQNTEWFRGEPSNSRGNQNCGEIWGENYGFRLNDDFCDKEQWALCERRLSE